jgi:hypothetical protein
MKWLSVLFCIFAAFLLVACNGGNPSTATPSPCHITTTGIECTFSVDRDLQDAHIAAPELPTPIPPLPPLPPCAEPTANITKQNVTSLANAQVILRDIPDLDQANVGILEGQYEGVAIPLDPSCNPTPVNITLHVDFELDYRSEFDRGHGVVMQICIARSDYEFTSFSVTGIDRLDDEIQSRVEGEVRDAILFAIDFAVADQINQTFLGTASPLSPNANPRCDGWVRGF